MPGAADIEVERHVRQIHLPALQRMLRRTGSGVAYTTASDSNGNLAGLVDAATEITGSLV